MHVSKDGGNTWDAAQIPLINKKQFYSILDMSEQMVFVHVDNAEGNFYTSPSLWYIIPTSFLWLWRRAWWSHHDSAFLVPNLDFLIWINVV